MDQSEITTSDWSQEVSEKNWVAIESVYTDVISTSCIDLLQEFSSALRLSITSNSSASTSQTLAFIASAKQDLPSFFASVCKAVSSELPVEVQSKDVEKPLEVQSEALEKPLEVQSENFEKPLEVQSKDLENPQPVFSRQISEEIASNVFQRVFDIFTKNNQSVQELYQSFDISRDGGVSFQEFRAGLLKHDSSITSEECQAVFEILDGNSDGAISLDELKKRMRLIKEKAELEELDPLACMVFSKPLDPSLVHGNLAIMLIKATGLKPGTHCVKIRVKNYIEYITPDTTEANPMWNYRADFFFENIKAEDLPTHVEIDLMNKNKLEGTGSFQWQKAMATPNEFVLKVKVEAKTSTGQPRGALFFQAQWTPISVKEYTEEELKHLEILEIKSELRKKELEADMEKPEIQSKVFEESPLLEEVKVDLAEKSRNSVKPGAYVYMIKKTTKIVKEIIDDKQKPTKPGISTRRPVDAQVLKQHVAASKIQGVWKNKKTN